MVVYKSSIYFAKLSFIIANKPAKYGLKIVMACDVGIKYIINVEPYLGKSTNTNKMLLGEYFVKRLIRTVEGTNRNIILDN